MKKLYNFLGGIYFAIFLIASIAIIVIIGTFLESTTESHRYASYFTYDNPLFTFLLCGLFINILFAATRRYPFKYKHIPFLTTHFGLLMILTGVFIKNAFGTQGALFIIEGSSTDEITLNNRYEIQMESHQDRAKFSLEAPTPLDGVKVKTIAYTPHSIEQYETAIKEDKLYLVNKKPVPLGVRDQIILQSSRWDILSLTSETPLEDAKKAYFENLIALIKEGENILFQGSLNETASLDLQENRLQLLFREKTITIPLDTLDNLSFYTIDLSQKPLLLFIKDKNDLHFFAFDAHGRVHKQIINHDNLKAYIAYDSGFGGYSVPLTFPHYSLNRAEQEAVGIHFLKNNLRESLSSTKQLSPPLQFFKNICEESNIDFSNTCIDFLVHWHKSQKLIQDTEGLSIVPACKNISDKELVACHWISILLQQVEPRLVKGENLLNILEDLEWPLLDSLKELDQEADLLQALTYQIYAISEELPKPRHLNYSGLLSAYLRLYGIQFQSVSQMIEKETPQQITFELPLSLRHTKAIASTKLEDNTPAVTLQLDDGRTKEILSLSYQKNGGGLKWPALNGKYLMRFQPKTLPIPFNVRLRNARQINYPGTEQAYSYESDLVFKDKRDGNEVEKTISMNHVHETWDGYRFYLSNISPGNETDVQRVQIAVNHDPAKYLVTYPGALITSLGIFLLFWMRPYGRKHY